MHRTLFALFLALLLTSLLAACSGDDDDSGGGVAGDDDDDDNDNDDVDDDDNDDVDDDDDNDDDDDSDDDDDDDNNDDDDDDDDNDDDDDDDTTYDQEPLAVAHASAVFAEIGDVLTFDGSASSDPGGRPLTYAWDFGDGETADQAVADHAFASAGARRVTLTVENDLGLTDQSSVVVSIGAFPAGVGALDEIGYAPNFHNATILEKGDAPLHGGLVYGFFVAPYDAVPDAILVNGLPGTPDQGVVEWCEVVGDELAAGQAAIVRCHSYDESFDAGQPLTLAVKEGDDVLWEFSGTLPAPTLTPTLITPSVDGAEILVHVRNDAAQALTIAGLAIDGLDVSDFVVIDNPQPAPGETALLRAPQAAGVIYGQWRVFSVLGDDGRAPLSVSRAMQLFPPSFPVGNWNHSSIFTDDALRQRQRDVGINMFIYYPSAELPPDTILAMAETEDFYLFTHVGGDLGDDYLNLVNNYGGHPRYLLNAVAGEPDIGGDEPLQVLEEVRAHRAVMQGQKPLWVYNACEYTFPSFGAIADYSGMDHYCVWAPKCNINFPLFYWDRIEFAGYYTEAIKRAAEPRPIWNWTQAIDNVEQIGQWQIRCNTPEEIRSQWQQVVGRGVKGILWFIFNEEEDANCPEEPKAEMARLRAELDQVADILLEGDPAPAGELAACADAQVDVAAIQSPYGMAIVLTNLDYDLNLIAPYHWREKTDVIIEVTPLGGFEPAGFALLDGDGQTSLAWQKIGAHRWRFTVPSMMSGATVLVTPEP